MKVLLLGLILELVGGVGAVIYCFKYFVGLDKKSLMLMVLGIIVLFVGFSITIV